MQLMSTTMVGDGWNNFKKRTGLTQHMSVKTMADKFIAMVEDGEFVFLGRGIQQDASFKVA